MEKQLARYSALFDEYLEKGVLPETDVSDDVLVAYLKEVLDDAGNRHLCETDMVWKELLRTSLMDFFRQMLLLFAPLEAEEEKELEYMEHFFGAELPTRRQMWTEVVEFVHREYPPSAVNLNGFIRLFTQTNIPHDAIFNAMQADWQNACLEKTESQKRELLERYKKKYEQQSVEAGKRDYQEIAQSASIFYKYPLLKEIVELIGREKNVSHEEMDVTVTRYIPLLLSHCTAHMEVEGIKTGDDLQAVLPTEVALLSVPATEMLFYQKFANKELQLFSSKPLSIKREKTEEERKKTPRLQEGPIILSIDTSGSMSGKPERVAKSLMMQILQMAKRKRRKCFLITYSVRSRTLDISRPENWRQVKTFLKEEFTGGTDGEEMLKDTLKALRTEDYSMADVLIISDFCFPYPMGITESKIREEQAKGVRFYGLQIGYHSKEYNRLLDKVWYIS